MSIRRRLIGAVCLLSLGSSAVSGQQSGNPFAEWDSLQKKTETTSQASAGSSAKPAVRPAQVEYFSPASPASSSAKAATLSASEVSLQKNLTILSTAQPRHIQTEKAQLKITESEKSSTASLIRERMKPAALTETQPNESPAKPAESAGTEQKLTEQSAAANPVQQAGTIQEADTIRRAEFLSDADSNSEAQGKVIPVSGVERPVRESAPAENPFAELLRAAEESSTPIPPAFDAPVQSTGSRFGNSAGAALSGSNAAGSKSPLARTTNADDAGTQSPGVTMEWIRHGEFNVGQPCSVELIVHNTSKAAVRGVLAEAMIPAELEVVSVSPQPTPGSPAPSWSLGDLKAGEKRSVSLQVVPRQRGNIELSASVRLTGSTSSMFAVQEPMIEVEVSGPDQAEVGQQVSYLVRASNPGTGVASNVLIQAAVPEGLEHRRGSLLTIEIGTLNPGESRQAQLSLTAIRGGAHQMAVRVVADGSLEDQTMASVRIAEPRLNLQISGPAEQMAGKTENYSLQLVNEGTVPSANVRARYRVPEGFEFISADRGGKYNPVDRSIEWFVGTIAAGGNSQFGVALRADETGRLLHQAGVISEHGKVTMAEHSTVVEGMAALDLKIAGSQAQLKIGDEVNYEVQVSNTGNRPAVNVGMSCELPSGLQLVQAAGPSDYIAENGVMVFKSLPQIEAGRSVSFTIRVRCTREGSHRLRLRVASESISEPLIGEENARVVIR